MHALQAMIDAASRLQPSPGILLSACTRFQSFNLLVAVNDIPVSAGWAQRTGRTTRDEDTFEVES